MFDALTNGATGAEANRRRGTAQIRGSQYTSEDFQRLLAGPRHPVQREQEKRLLELRDREFLLVVKTLERVGKLLTRNEVRGAVFDYIERFYNPQRPCLTLGHVGQDQVQESARELTVVSEGMSEAHFSPVAE